MTEWVEVASTSFGTTNIHDIAHDQVSKWVAVGSGGKIATSSNGTDWGQCASSGFVGDVICVAFGDGMWIAASGNGELATSPDGENWTQQTLTPGWFTDIAYGNGLWIVCDGIANIIQTSPNGVNWAQISHEIVEEFGRGVCGVSYNGTNLWCAVSESYNETSPDGASWTLGGQSFNNSLSAISHNTTDQWVAGGSKLNYSPDGENWTQLDPLPGGTIHGVEHNGSEWNICGNNGQISSSPDAITWTPNTSPLSETLNGIAFDGTDKWIVVGDNGKMATGAESVPNTSGMDIGTTKKAFWLNRTLTG